MISCSVTSSELLQVYVTNPDGSPAARVPVVSEPLAANAITQNDGTAKLILNTPGNAQELRITVSHSDFIVNSFKCTVVIGRTTFHTQNQNCGSLATCVNFQGKTHWSLVWWSTHFVC